MTTKSKIKQDGNIVHGDQAGKTIIKNYYPKPKTAMTSLIEQYKEEIKQNKSLRDFIGELQHWLNSIDDDTEIIGLEKKLEVGGRSEEVYEALKLKELFVKKLKSSQFSEAAQGILAFILGDMRESYRVYVYPLIKQGTHKSVVDKAVLEKVLNPLLSKLEENPLRLSVTELRGMLYFLTGNCYIRWD